MLRFADFPAHMQLLLLCARTRADEATRQALAERCSDLALNWDEFLAVTQHHRLASLVFDALSRQPTPEVPPGVRAALHQQSTGNAFEALRSTQEVRRIAALYAEAGIELSVMKGVPLSQILFGSPNARHVGDIDLLAPPERLPRQIELLAAAGYTLINPGCRLTPSRVRSYVRFWKDFTFSNLASGFELDLHWRLFNNRFHAANPILSEASYTTVEVFGVPMRVFSPRDQFIYIAAHGISDAWTYLKSLTDVAGFLQLFSRAELEDALLRAKQLGLLAQISAAIHLANDWLGAGASSPLLLPPGDAIAVEIHERTSAALLAHNFRPHRSHTSPAQWLALELKLVPGARSLAEVLRRFVWRPRVWASLDLPDRLFWIYPVVGLLMLPRHHSLEDQS